MHTIRLSLDAAYSIPTIKFGKFSAGLGYTFEHIINYGVDRDIFVGTGTNGNPGTATASDVQQSLEIWRSALTNKTNHYIRVNLKYEW